MISMNKTTNESSLSGELHVLEQTMPSKTPPQRFRNGMAAAYLLLAAVLLITLCSKSSPLYPLNDWVDANCFFTVGKSMLRGLLPYRDLWEQKGPFLYMLHAVAAMISYRTFFGVYLLEIAAAFGFLWYSYRACRVLTEKSSVLVFLPLMGALVFASRPFAHGDSVEQLALAPLAYALYQGLLVVERKQPMRFGQAVGIGITSGMVFWSKYTLVGLYVGWIIVVAFITVKEAGMSALLHLLVGILAGLLLITVPILLYFLLQGALSDLVQGYFIDNLFSYSRVDGQGNSLFSNLRTGYNVARSTLGFVFPMGALGLFWCLIYRPLRTFFHLLFQAFFMLCLIYIGGRFYVYYALPLSVFACIGCAALVEWSAVFWQHVFRNDREVPAETPLENRTRVRRGERKALSSFIQAGLLTLAFAVGYATFFSPNAYLRGTVREELPQYRFAQQIQKKEHPTLLNYGFLDGGFYTVTGIVPNVRAFCRLNLPSSEMEQEQEDAIREGRVDFIVTRGEEREFPGYRLIDRADFFFEAPQHYALYEKE
ncbi:hypothetical protein [Murdochiella vaginalis]|uniref:hypothetical protein n=1 Tax=Murdochiella vaginalis TaxID=1852373 RepID=UPI0008FDB25A|nr:hypothetical protein [Murdochiella vaginalis]